MKYVSLKQRPSVNIRTRCRWSKVFIRNVRSDIARYRLIFVLIKGATQPTQIAKFMGPTWGPPGSCRSQMGPMLAPWTLLSEQGSFFSHSIRDVSTATWISSCFLLLYGYGIVTLICGNPKRRQVLWQRIPVNEAWLNSRRFQSFYGIVKIWQFKHHVFASKFKHSDTQNA